ncbi:YHS domain-containing (seleno)protein [Devosia sp.]|uniref:YHS domain-containing (seleno)protein n=1 Tax=Devosia sp. TaxID=1871048 RepID=UPI002FC9F319
MDRRRFILSAAIAPFGVAAILATSVTIARAGKAAVYTGPVPGIGAGGYDVVAYFTDGRPTKGSAAHVAAHEGVTYRFASATTRDKFVKSPGRYLPQYGGYCAYAVSQGATASSDPSAWTIVEDKLYLNYSKSVRSIWRQDVPGNISKADKNWPAVLN